MRPHLAYFGITDFICEKLVNRTCAKLILLDVDKGQRFIARYGKPNGQRRPASQLIMNRRYVHCAVSRNQPDEYLLRSLELKATKSMALSQVGPAAHHMQSSSFKISQLQCGVWSFDNDELVFEPHFLDSRRGRILFGHRQVALLYEDRDSLESSSAYRINFKYFDVDTVIIGDDESPTVSFTLHVAPAFYCKPSINLTEAFANFSLLGVNGVKLPPLKEETNHKHQSNPRRDCQHLLGIPDTARRLRTTT